MYLLETTEPSIKTLGVDCIWSSGIARMVEGQITGQKYFEELLMDPETVRLDFMNSGYCPVNLGHKGRQVGNIVEGSSFIEDGKGHAKIQFFDDSFSLTIFDEIKNGKRSTALSVAVKPFDYLKLKGKNGNPDTLIFTEWQPYEIALVERGADPGARILI